MFITKKKHNQILSKVYKEYDTKVLKLETELEQGHKAYLEEVTKHKKELEEARNLVSNKVDKNAKIGFEITQYGANINVYYK